MGYGSRCLELLQDYYEGKIINLNETPANGAAQEVVREEPKVRSSEKKKKKKKKKKKNWH